MFNYWKCLEFVDKELPYFVKYITAFDEPLRKEEDFFLKFEVVDNKMVYYTGKRMDELYLKDAALELIHAFIHLVRRHPWMKYEQEDRMNLACEIYVNDVMEKQLPKLAERISNGINGAQYLGYSSYGMTESEIYDLLPEDEDYENTECLNSQFQIQNTINNDGNGGGGSSDENGDNENSDDIESYMPYSSDDFDDEREAFDDSRNSSKSYSLTGYGDEKSFKLDKRIQGNWEKILDEIAPSWRESCDSFVDRKWGFNAPRRKTAWMAPDIVLPTIIEKDGDDEEGFGKKKNIALFLDTSGSIGSDDLETFIALSKGFPTDKVDIDFYGFHTIVYKIDIENIRIMSGSTKFDSVIKKVDTKKEDEYDGVIVITDGYSPITRQPKDPDKWFWIISRGGSRNYINSYFKNIYNINSIIKL